MYVNCIHIDQRPGARVKITATNARRPTKMMKEEDSCLASLGPNSVALHIAHASCLWRQQSQRIQRCITLLYFVIILLLTIMHVTYTCVVFTCTHAWLWP